jgi:hypothetical protein
MTSPIPGMSSHPRLNTPPTGSLDGAKFYADIPQTGDGKSIPDVQHVYSDFHPSSIRAGMISATFL